MQENPAATHSPALALSPCDSLLPSISLQGTGWDVAALSDTYREYAGSCGRCYEVKCQNNGFKDGYGNWIDRKGEQGFGKHQHFAVPQQSIYL
jgi:hypothetical protein